MLYELNKESIEKFVDRIFSYHNPQNIPSIRFEELRASAKMMAKSVLINGGHNRGEDMKQAIEHIRLALFYAISSIVIPAEDAIPITISKTKK